MHCPLDALPARADDDNEIDDDGGDDDDADDADDDEKNLDKFQIPEEKRNATLQHTLYM